MEAHKGRKFGGKLYKYDSAPRTKASVNKRLKMFRSDGYDARFTKTKTGWQVYFKRREGKRAWDYGKD